MPTPDPGFQSYIKRIQSARERAESYEADVAQGCEEIIAAILPDFKLITLDQAAELSKWVSACPS